MPQIPDYSATQVVVRNVKRKEIDCPNCNKPLILGAAGWGTTLTCPECNQKTYNPVYEKWWHRPRNFIGTLILGIIASLIAGIILQSSFKWGG